MANDHWPHDRADDDRARDDGAHDDGADGLLSALDTTILRRLGRGDSATAVASDLGVTVGSLVERVGAIRHRLGVTSTAAAALAARERGLL